MLKLAPFNILYQGRHKKRSCSKNDYTCIIY